LIGRLAGVVVHPRATMVQVVAQPDWLLPWIVLLVVWAACAIPFLSTDVGRQALVDDQVRRVEAFGGEVDDARYQAWQKRPPLMAYFASADRFLLTPPVTLAVAMGLLGLARRNHVQPSLTQALAVSIYASVPLVLGHVVATPVQYLRESLSTPFNLAALVPVADEGTWAARLLGAIDLFALWWSWLLAVGLGAMTRRPSRRYLGWLLAIYGGVAAVVSTILN
jgi:hypothetical protein